MTQTDKHSPTERPWKVHNGCIAEDRDDGFPHYIKLESAWIEGAWNRNAEAAANAALIVRAVNSHDELVEALRELVAKTYPTYGSETSKAYQKARAALARLEQANG